MNRSQQLQHDIDEIIDPATLLLGTAIIAGGGYIGDKVVDAVRTFTSASSPVSGNYYSNRKTSKSKEDIEYEKVRSNYLKKGKCGAGWVYYKNKNACVKRQKGLLGTTLRCVSVGEYPATWEEKA